ncbi:MAG: acyltransferase family protein [Methanosarcina sp.]
MTYEKWIDTAKGIGILLVILGHSNFNQSAIVIISTFNMPLFFFLSGYLYNHSKYKQDPNRFMALKFKRLVIPYFITNIIILCTYAVLSFFKIYSFNEKPPLKHLIGIFYGNGAPLDPPTIYTNTLNIPSWFLLSLFCAFLLLYILAFTHEKYGLRISGLLGVLFLLSGFEISKHIFLPWGFDIACVSMFFMFLAYLTSGNRERYARLAWLDRNGSENLKKILYCSVLILLLYFVISFNGRVDMNTRNYANLPIFYIGGLLGTTMIIGIAKELSKKENILTNSFVFLGKHSLIILLYHSFTSLLLILILNIFINVKEIIYNSPILSILNMLLTSILVVVFFRKLPVLEKIYFT